MFELWCFELAIILCDMLFCGDPEPDMFNLALVVLLLRTKSFLGVSLLLRLELPLNRSFVSDVSFSILLMVFLRTGGTRIRCVKFVGVVLCE